MLSLLDHAVVLHLFFSSTPQDMETPTTAIRTPARGQWPNMDNHLQWEVVTALLELHSSIFYTPAGTVSTGLVNW